MGDIGYWTTETLSFDTGALMSRFLMLHTGPPCTSDQQVLWLRGDYIFQDQGVSVYNANWRAASYFSTNALIAVNTQHLVDYLNVYCACLRKRMILPLELCLSLCVCG